MSNPLMQPDVYCDTLANFDIEMPWPVPAFSGGGEHVPKRDAAYKFQPEVVRALLMGFAHNRRVFLHGPHGCGKSSHIEQVAARLNWPCMRINLDGHVTRADLIGRDVITLREGKQVTEFLPGLLVWALERPIALVFDEYDAGRPDVMFVLQRVLESHGMLTLLDQNRVITPHPAFRLFATANTAGQGDASGIYAGTQPLNQAQLDRWHVVCELNQLSADAEIAILIGRVPTLDLDLARKMVAFAGLCRQAFGNGDLSLLISLRTMITWAENVSLLGAGDLAAKFSFYNRCDDAERMLIAEMYQRCFGVDFQVGVDARRTY